MHKRNILYVVNICRIIAKGIFYSDNSNVCYVIESRDEKHINNQSWFHDGMKGLYTKYKLTYIKRRNVCYTYISISAPLV